MGNLSETKPLGRLTVVMGDDRYVMESSGGGTPPPNSVGTEQIIDGAVEMQDLNEAVKDTMMTGDDRVTSEDLDNFDV